MPAGRSSRMARCSGCWLEACRRDTSSLPRTRSTSSLPASWRVATVSRRVEIIRDGRVERRVPAAELAKTGSLGKLPFVERLVSGTRDCGSSPDLQVRVDGAVVCG